MVTVTPASTAPVLSWTTPETVPVAICAAAAPAVAAEGSGVVDGGRAEVSA